MPLYVVPPVSFLCPFSPLQSPACCRVTSDSPLRQVATTAPCLKPFMSALNTHYGGPRVLKTPGGTKASNSGNEYSLNTMNNMSRHRAAEKAASASVTASSTKWDEPGYNVEVNIGDDGSLQSEGSKRMIISKNTTWAVDYEEQGRAAGRAL